MKNIILALALLTMIPAAHAAESNSGFGVPGFANRVPAALEDKTEAKIDNVARGDSSQAAVKIQAQGLAEIAPAAGHAADAVKATPAPVKK